MVHQVMDSRSQEQAGHGNHHQPQVQRIEAGEHFSGIGEVRFHGSHAAEKHRRFKNASRNGKSS